METKLGSVPVEGWTSGGGLVHTGFMLEVFQADVTHPDEAIRYRIRLQVRREGEGTCSLIPWFLTPSAARALAALLTLPVQTP